MTIFFCVPDVQGVQAHYWDGVSGLLCRPPKGEVPAERALCQRHRSEAEKPVAPPKYGRRYS
jgi:hypothetical protein